jgi:HNH endonuclease
LSRSISKRVRFEVFKRDGFTCQYCGAHPPHVILEVDHINPVVDGGLDDMDNLATACFPCNRGKGPISLLNVPLSLKDKAFLIAESEEQLRGYHAIIEAKRLRQVTEAWKIVEILQPKCRKFPIRGIHSIIRFVEQLGLYQVVEAAEIAFDRQRWSEDRRFRYFCGICWKLIRESGDENA